jgi:hypothetical protein
MEVVISTTSDEAGKLAADAIAELVRHRPEAPRRRDHEDP